MVKTRHSAETEDSPAHFVSLQRIATRRSRNYEHGGLSSGESDGDYIKGMTTRRRSCRTLRNVSHSDPNKRRRVACIEDSADEDTPERQMVQGSSRQLSAVNGDSFGMIRRSTRQKKPLYDTLNQSLIIDNAALGLVDVKGELPVEPVQTQRRGRQSARDVEADYEGDNYSDMYSRVKRARRRFKQDMYGIPIPDQGEETEASESDAEAENTQEDEEEVNNKEDEEDDEDDVLPPRRSYYLREHKPRTQIYEAPPIEPQLRRSCKTPAIYPVSPSRKRKVPDHHVYRSPARRNSIRRKAAFHGSSSTSSDSSSSDDENRFERRKAKSMAKARNRCLPMNLDADDIIGIRKERNRIGSSLADVDPMTVDRSVNFDSVGGLGKHVRALKEMVVFPLLYPEVFEKFKISPPRGVLFYGPPGTGKTLVARALANECSHDDKRVAFFMRKGADCLSKWVGESERQLRMLFDQAYQMRPSIIFFDEIDGLAPVRSSRQDQIHSSIVSTLLALMDGLDSRGEIVVIGATNRIDSIDPALRRPGRFDREFLFPLPSVEARQQILKIHTKAWTPKVADPFLGELAERCVGYCGADLKALCTEAALLALRRRYPQIYTSSEKLQLDVSSINVSAKDFCSAMQVIVPTSQRSVTSPARALSKTVAPLLRVVLQEVLKLLHTIFPSHIANTAGVDVPSAKSGCKTDGSPAIKLDEFCSDDEEDAPSIFEHSPGRQNKRNSDTESFFSFGFSASKSPITHRPRLMLSGTAGQGQTSHLAPAVLHHMERLPVHILDLPAMFACSAKSPEESCAQVFREAKRTAPSILYMPHIDRWWSVLSDTLQATFLTLVHDMDPSAPVLLLATSDSSYVILESTLRTLFDNRYGEVMTMKNPNGEERREYFADLLKRQATKPPTRRKQAALRALEVLPKAPPPKPRELTQEEKKKMEQQEEATNRELRLFLRDALNKIARDRKFNIFAKPVDVEEVPDYYEIVKHPMDLSTMMSKIDLHLYQSVKEFLADIGLICSNALEYNPDKDPAGRAIRHRACALRDTAHSIVENELDPEFEKLCNEMVESRQRRGAEPRRAIPDFYFTKPIHKHDEVNQPYPCRFSKRTRGMEAEDWSVELVKKPRETKKSVVIVTEEKSSNEIPSKASEICETPAKDSETCETPAKDSETPNTDSVKQSISDKTLSSSKKPYKKRKCVWNYKSRRRRKNQPLNVFRSQTQSASHTQEKEKEVMDGDSSAASDEEEDEISFGKSPKSTKQTVPAESAESDDSDNTVLNGIEESTKEKTSTLTTTESPDKSSSEHFTTVLQQTSTSYHDKTSPGSRGEVDFSDLKLLNAESTSSAVIDSGIGSSMESNCESMDSVDQLKQQTGDSTGGVTPVETIQSTEHVIEDTPRKPGEGTPASFRLTRSRSSNKDALQALQILEEPEPPLVVDHGRLDGLLRLLVERTHNYTVESLGKLYSVLSRCVFHHRKNYDKTQLVQDLESVVDRYTGVSSNHNPILPSTSTHNH
ncbi:ATPase family AAA domain-containing protein 2-like isoform X2 [Liolophura sinensis]|uniref:ATPase family AAA domain-containing protein 2-like isoform X2 n=1 Tax=Liolophura sinensis TaxID=3198878 RepID=UPI0031588C8F